MSPAAHALASNASVSTLGIVVSALPCTINTGAPAGRFPAEFWCSNVWMTGMVSGSWARTSGPLVPWNASITSPAHCVVAASDFACASGDSTAAGSASGYAAWKPWMPIAR